MCYPITHMCRVCIKPVSAEPPVCRGLCFIQCEQAPFVVDSLHDYCQASQAVILSELDPNEAIPDEEMLNSYMNFDSVPLNEMHVDCRASQAVILGEPDFNELIAGQEMLGSQMNVDSFPVNEMNVDNTAYSADVSEYEVPTKCEKEAQSYPPNTMVNDSPNPMVEASIADDQAECTSDWSPCMETNAVLMGSLSQLREQKAFETYIRQDMFDGEEEVAIQHGETLSE
ncbi:hypothetical protein F5Y01DRAFT_322222 [Xylaria sp. FL0043]|nr:hypothetical protein F5Y01DRAFT_322222 [Xylaria sp. FL0043]